MNPGPRGLLPAACTVLAIAGCLLGWFLPWITVSGSDASVDRQALASSKILYERALVLAPALGLPVAAGAMAFVAIAQARSTMRWLPLAYVTAVAGGLVACVAGLRITGFALVRALDPGAAVVWPGAAALASLAAGAAVVGVALHALWNEGRRPAGSSLAAAATLLLMPLLPFGRSGSGTFHYDELTLAATAPTGGILSDAAVALSWMRGALWVAVAGGLLVLALDAIGKPLRRAWPMLALAPGPLAAVALFAFFQVRWAAVDGLGLSWNAVAPLGALASVGFLVWPMRSALRGRGQVAAGGESQ